MPHRGPKDANYGWHGINRKKVGESHPQLLKRACFRQGQCKKNQEIERAEFIPARPGCDNLAGLGKLLYLESSNSDGLVNLQAWHEGKAPITDRNRKGLGNYGVLRLCIQAIVCGHSNGNLALTTTRC